MTTNRSSEELEMRALIVPELRKRYPTARIVHELPLRYSTNRIDLAAITETEIVSVEIKSSKDVADRLEKQVRAFLPVSVRVIVALAPVWNVKLPELVEPVKGGTRYRKQYTECQEILRRVRDDECVETWTVDAQAGTIEVTDGAWRRNSLPWPSRMLDMLHVSELVEIAGHHRCWQGKRPVHLQVRDACADMMTGREVTAAVCRALRRRNAFCVGTDSPIDTPDMFIEKPVVQEKML